MHVARRSGGSLTLHGGGWGARHGTTHDVLACWFGVDRSTITRAIGEVRPLLAQRGCTIAPGVRLCTFTEVIEHLGADGQTGIIDGTEIRVRRPAAGRRNAARPTRVWATATTARTSATGRRPLPCWHCPCRCLWPERSCSPVAASVGG
ncbi:transposase family protein [Streptomyces collinus]|uniref:transposase family protein n=1 Tax=Streptomyces collinus TaxID=42684 RepID=UPI0037892CCA